MSDLPPSNPGSHPTSPTDLLKRTSTRLEVPLLIIAGILLIFFIREARVALLPIALALLLSLLAWPLRAWLTRHMAGWLAGLLVSALLVVLLVILGWGAWWVVDRVVTQATEMQDQFIEMYERGVAWLASIGMPERWLPPSTLDPQEWRGVTLTDQGLQRIVNFVTAGVGGVGWFLVLVGLAIGMFMLLMLEIPRWDERASEVFGRDAYCRTRDSFKKSATQLRFYLLAKAISGAAAGILTTILCWAMGVPLAMMWGVMTLVLNFIPNVGSFIVGIPLTIFALMQLGTFDWLIFMAILLTIEATTSNILDPLVQGNVMLLSPFEVTVALVFWAWMWGVPGAFLAVPLSAAAVVAMRNAYRLKPVGRLLSD